MISRHRVHPHPFGDVAIAGVYNTPQARRLPEHTSTSIALAGAVGALADARISPGEVDGVVGPASAEIALELGLGPCTRRPSGLGIPAVLDAAALIVTGQCSVVVVAAGGAGVHTDATSTAPWTRPANELVVSYGLFTAAEFALMARRHMLTYGTTSEQMATVAATIRNNGHVNPEAIYFGRGPFTADDILASRMVADPFHLLDCATTSEGGCALVLVAADRATDTPAPVWILGGASDSFGPAYMVPPVWDFRPRPRWRMLRTRRGPGGARVVRHGRPDPGRRRRGGALRPLLLRDHPTARNIRILPRRRGRRVRERRQHRPGWPAPRHHRWRHHVVQPRR